MNECLNNEPNYITYYNSIQMCLPLGLGYEITPTDELLSFLEAIKGVDLSKYMVRKETRGRKGHGTLTVAEPLILKNVDYNVIFLSNF